MENSNKASFQWQDYLVFSIMLVISSVIGLYFGIKAKRRKASADEMLTGNRNLPVLPVALSLSASFTSATTILGIPGEVYLRGGEQWLWCFGLVLCFLIITCFMLPFFHKLQLTNAYEYLEIRFHKVIRYMGSIAFSVIILIYMAAVLYAPAVALSQVTGLSTEISILAMGAVCTFYTSIGGIRAVVWTDAFQLIVVWAGLLALLIKGAVDAGGWTNVWKVSKNGSRLPKFNMDPNPFIRHTFWTLLIGGCTNMMTVYGANQTNLQRYASVRTLAGARLALILNLPLWIIYITILCLLGLVMYAYFETCDPITAGSVVTQDQLIPLFVLKTMGDFPGLPGLFVACIFSASISTVSSGINSLAAVTLEDLFKPCYHLVHRKPPSQGISSVATVILAIIFGAITIGLAYLAKLLGKTVLTITFGIFGIVGGPLLGLIMSGMFIPFMNSWGAGVGMIASLIACFYVGIDPVFNPPPKNDLPVRSDQCPGNNITSTTLLYNITSSTTTFPSNVTMTHHISSSDGHLYLSYIHYSTLALIVSGLVGSFVSAITCCNRGRDVDERTYYKYSWCCFHKSSTKYTFDYSDDHNSHRRNNNLAKQEVRDSHELYSKNGDIKRETPNFIYTNDACSIMD
ncbi:unnamed protein product [Candidula unifasciata]|uniref:Sodium-coupled monocarboxylate transporter 1 n=1 Tax=Candidula unifasciata TaxID=100452 RepID=A0A8S3YUY9_9EUPU|nr:unnamed protein product [Candidula unifasciata]